MNLELSSLALGSNPWRTSKKWRTGIYIYIYSAKFCNSMYDVNLADDALPAPCPSHISSQDTENMDQLETQPWARRPKTGRFYSLSSRKMYFQIVAYAKATDLPAEACYFLNDRLVPSLYQCNILQIWCRFLVAKIMNMKNVRAKWRPLWTYMCFQNYLFGLMCQEYHSACGPAGWEARVLSRVLISCHLPQLHLDIIHRYVFFWNLETM